MLPLARAIAVNAGVDDVLMFRFHATARRIAEKFGPQTARAWMRAVTRFQGTIDEKALRAALSAKSLVQINAAVGASSFGQMMRDLEKPFARTATATGTASAKVLSEAGFPMQFNAVHPNVVQFARDQAAALVVDVTDDVREAVRTVVALGAQQGLTVEQQARAIREVVGLPPNQARAPLRLGAEIRAGRAGRATRRRLSATTKAQIRSRVARGTVTEAFIERVQKQYAASLTNRRALNIAGTESRRAANFGQSESWQQAVDQGSLPADSRRFWLPTPDERLSEEHARIPSMNSDGRGMNEPFDTPEGSFMYPPSRTNCRCGIGLGVGTGQGAPATLPPPPTTAPRGRTQIPPQVPRRTPKKPKKPALDDAAIMSQPSSAYPPIKESDETLGRYMRGSGRFTSERKQLHDAIVRDHLRGITPADDPRVMIMGGGPASGKSGLLKTIPLPNHVRIDVDRIRTILPEFVEGVKVGKTNVAAITHEESSLLAKRIAREAGKRKYNIMVDGTGDSSFENMVAKVKGYRATGHRVIANYVTVDTETAIARAFARGERTGRFVPETVTRTIHEKVTSVFVQAVERGLFDEVTLWDTNGSVLLKVAQAVGKKFSILDEVAYQRFLAKAPGLPLQGAPLVAQLDTVFANYNVSPVGQRALRAWRGVFGEAEEINEMLYWQLNAALRAGHKLGTKALPFGTGQLGDVGISIDRVIAAAPRLGRKGVFWRGGQIPKSVRVGDTIKDRGFVSATTDRATAERFSADQINEGGALVRITTSDQQRGAWMRGLVTKGDDLVPVEEFEFLLPRNTSFEITRIRVLTFEEYTAEFGSVSPGVLDVGETIRIIDVRVLP